MREKIKWYHWVVWALYAVAMGLLVYGIFRNLLK